MMTTSTTLRQSHVRGVRLYRMHQVEDRFRGNLTVGEFGRDLPFKPQRYFITYDIPADMVRGAHAHKTCEQFVLCVRGQCSLIVDDGVNRDVLRLERPDVGAYVPSMTWLTECNHTPDAALLIFASLPYDPGDYIHDHEVFRGLSRSATLNECR